MTAVLVVALCSILGIADAAAFEGQRTSVPLEVTSSTPAEGQADVRLDTAIRIQFSGAVDERSLRNRVRLRYSQAESKERGEAQPPALRFVLRYDAENYAITITPTQHFERFREVLVDLLGGIVSVDGSALKPWSLRFNTGGSP